MEFYSSDEHSSDKLWLGFPLAKAASRALNSHMDKDASATPLQEVRVGLISDIVRGKSWKYTLSLGLIGGIAIGVLNLSAVATESRLQAFFDALNYPVISLLSTANDVIGFMNGKSPDVCEFYMLVGVVCYWSIIGVFLASILCLARDRICRRALKIGAAGGVLVGCLNFMTTIDEWNGTGRYFNILYLAIALPLDADRIRVEIILWLIVVVAYWTLIGLFLAWLFCAVRILKKRNAARGTEVSEE